MQNNRGCRLGAFHVPEDSRRRLTISRLFVALGAGLFTAIVANRCFIAAQPARSRWPLSPGLRIVPARTAMAAAASLDDAKAVLREMIEDKDLMKEMSQPDGKAKRGLIDEAIVELERFSPIDEPVFSTLLDGRWLLKYAGWYAPGLLSSPTRELALLLYGGGFSLGGALSSLAEGFWGQMLGVKLGSMTVEIKDGKEVKSAAEFELLNGWHETLRYTAELMPLSARRFNEDIVSVELPAFIGHQESPLKIERGILVTYLDEELMIVRDESGIPEVLQRVVDAGGAGSGPSVVDAA